MKSYIACFKTFSLDISFEKVNKYGVSECWVTVIDSLLVTGNWTFQTNKTMKQYDFRYPFMDLLTSS